MAKKHFLDLIEAQSHLKAKMNLQKQIEQESARVSSLDQQILKKKERLAELEAHQSLVKTTIQEMERELSLKDGQRVQAEQARESASNQNALDSALKQFDVLTGHIDQLQDELFKRLEEEEAVQKEAEVLSSFLKGVEETKKDIQSDVSRACDPLISEMAKLDERVEALLGIVHPELKAVFLNAAKKHPSSPLTYIDSRRCAQCKWQAESTLAESLERGDHYYQCDGCARLFLPPSIHS